MPTALKDLLSSKKFLTALVAAIVAGALLLGWHVDETTVGLILSPLLAAIVGQSVADIGKPAAEVQVKADEARITAPPAPPPVDLRQPYDPATVPIVGDVP